VSGLGTGTAIGPNAHGAKVILEGMAAVSDDDFDDEDDDYDEDDDFEVGQRRRNTDSK
jgi:hypothetical protein